MAGGWCCARPSNRWAPAAIPRKVAGKSESRIPEIRMKRERERNSEIRMPEIRMERERNSEIRIPEIRMRGVRCLLLIRAFGIREFGFSVPAPSFTQHHTFQKPRIHIPALEVLIVHDLQLQRDGGFDGGDVELA